MLLTDFSLVKISGQLIDPENSSKLTQWLTIYQVERVISYVLRRILNMIRQI
jgi:hypothetical protein